MWQPCRGVASHHRPSMQPALETFPGEAPSQTPWCPLGLLPSLTRGCLPLKDGQHLFGQPPRSRARHCGGRPSLPGERHHHWKGGGDKPWVSLIMQPSSKG